MEEEQGGETEVPKRQETFLALDRSFSFKKIIRRIHLWLGLASGLVVFVVSLSGCIYVFQQQIFEASHRKVLFVRPGARTLSLSSLWARAQAEMGDSFPVSTAGIYNDPARSW